MSQRIDWFNEARFGMFIHWGLYAIPARGEWVMQNEHIDPAVYEQYAAHFDPVHFDARAWARAAKQAGMRYMVLTAKHHDGFCLFDSALTTYKSTNSPAGRDFVREFLEAGRAEGLRVGLYYSLLDWHHPAYPAYGEENHPMEHNEAWKDKPHDFGAYLDYMHAQVEELVTGYGKLDLLWFDFCYADRRGEAWRATKLVEMIRRHQPDILINDRLGGGAPGSGATSGEAYGGDFVSPEQTLPVDPPTAPDGSPLPWEMCATLNNSWGYNAYDNAWKPAWLIIHKLIECVSKGGNMILNVGPDALGQIPQPSLAILKEVGEWLAVNGEAIYGCGAAALPRPEWGRYTQKGDTVYAHLFEATIGPVPLAGLSRDEIQRVTRLADGSEMPFASGALVVRHDHTIPYYALCAQDHNYTLPLSDERATVLKIQTHE